MSFLSALKEKFSKKNDKAQYLSGFAKSRQQFGQRLNSLSEDFDGISDEFLEQLTIILLEADVGIDTADLICDTLKERAQDYPTVSFKWAMNLLIEIMKEIYEEYPDEPIHFNENGPTVIFLEGVNGSGKTTTAAKLASMYQGQGKSVVFTAADTFRAGAIDQLCEWGERLHVPTVKGLENGDPSAAIVDGCRYAKEHHSDILICDTAGRLQNKANLMNELAKMNRVTAREIEGAPHNTWLVLDATTGQNGLAQAEIFNESTELSGIILTKMDGTAKGGIVIAIKNKLHLPVYYIGLGEHPEDLRPFDLDSYLYSISEGLQSDGE
ncbi:MAG: signal recognition particle-docking protein FtsY [Solobacterium sp.]|jgi:fused signal recognition particle receptor|nr:signal recognition particle-docking protein FtsY [Solobacterium sp.]MCH4205012.1 signal recognition particle-docking protein FtsY [Solobacterium sp.]MCH4226521.1 signal recognition particle-docking protein FtsY [Solobacterium sp.]MCH4281805.1 signal recognition particle-docking protein FtsY [Solobacterium sp.]